MSTPQLNIKDAEATRLVRELTDLTGETQTQAVRTALRERLEREKAEREKHASSTSETKRREVERMWRETQEIYDRVAAQRSGETGLTEDDLYDDNGLPK
jgi:antitoxin VapB